MANARSGRRSDPRAMAKTRGSETPFELINARSGSLTRGSYDDSLALPQTPGVSEDTRCLNAENGGGRPL